MRRIAKAARACQYPLTGCCSLLAWHWQVCRALVRRRALGFYQLVARCLHAASTGQAAVEELESSSQQRKMRC